VHVDRGELVLSPTDLVNHLACAHLTNLDLRASRGEITPPEEANEALELLFRRGLDHERAYLERLQRSGLEVVEIPADADLAERAARTDRAMRAGASVIYQATFLYDGERGHADFLLRAERSSSLGPHAYDVADTKLARRMKVAAVVQMAGYGRHLERVQGVPPEWLIVVSGDGKEHPFPYRNAAAFERRALERLRKAIAEPTETRPEPCAHCAQCRWAPRCEDEWRQSDHLSLVAFMRRDHRLALGAAGIRTVADLAAAEPSALPRSIGEPSRLRLRHQASLQIAERETGLPSYDLLEPTDGLGLLRLPEPSALDVYLDFEGDPYEAEGNGREYLAGLGDRDGHYRSYWAHSRKEERALTKDLLADLVARLDADPGMHVYHYAPYERAALERLTQRHGVGEADLDRLLRAEAFVDLYAVVRQGIRISKPSYSLKKLEAFYWDGERHSGDGDRGGEVADALGSVVAYERWLVERDNAILAEIEDYNREDVRSTHELHTWLEARRAELECRHGPQPRPAVRNGQPSGRTTEAGTAEEALVEKLTSRSFPLLAGLVGWHRREENAQWWDFFRLGALADEELVDDTAAIGRLGEPECPRVLPPPARSTVWHYPFPPQDTKLRAHDSAVDVDTREGVGEILALDPSAGWVDLKIASNREPPHPRGLGPTGPPDTTALRSSLCRTATEVLSGGTPLGLRLLDRVVPPAALGPEETPADGVVRIGRGLADAVLAVQGPPGSGKTTVGARLIGALLDDGRRVGVTGPSHAVIGNLLQAVGRPALQRCEAGNHCGAPDVDRAANNDTVAAALASGSQRLVGGTAWLWARKELEGSLDVLVVDEAGQFSLANAVAVARSAKNLVLLGDPQQLAQPSQAAHPDGAGISALEHLLDGAATLPPERGVFLDRTWRLHPDLAKTVSALMYDGRLDAAPGCDRQVITGTRGWNGAGIRWVPVPHTGNRSVSQEEADTVSRVVAELLEGSWVDANGTTNRLGPDDLLVVAPYNAHVARLRNTLPTGARVGTVDKFQGQEAPVVLYAMGSSSAEDAPRGVGFLYDLHRLNVAISRARCLAVVVASPALLDAAVSTPEELAAVNGLLAVASAGRASG
jgi:uncharacterized protein